MTESSESQLFWITEFLAIGPRHGEGGPGMDRLNQLGFGKVIDLNADPYEKMEAETAGLEYYGMPITDDASDQHWLALLSQASKIIREAHDEERPVYLHCTYGVGRSPTVAMAYLVSRGDSVEHAVELVKVKHPGTWNPGNPVSKYERILQDFKQKSRVTKLIR